MSPLNISLLESAIKTLLESKIAALEIKVKAHDVESGALVDVVPQVIVGLSSEVFPKSESCMAVAVADVPSEVAGVYLPEVWLIAASPALVKGITEADNRALYSSISGIFQDRPRKLSDETQEAFALRVAAWVAWREEVSEAVLESTGYVSTGWESNQVGYIRENDIWQHRLTFFLSCVHPSFVAN